MQKPNSRSPGALLRARLLATLPSPRALLGLGRRGLAPAALAAFAVLGHASTAANELALHPQDGPHLDLKVLVAEGGVVLQIQLNVACADELVEPAREDLDRVHPVELPALQENLEACFAREVDVFVDGIEVQPVTERFDFFEADPGLVALFPRFGARALATVRLDLAYSAKAPPDEVRLVWRAYPPDLASAMPGQEPRKLDVLAKVEAGGTQKVVPLSWDAPELLWTASGARQAESVRFLDVPEVAEREPVAVSLVTLGALALFCVAALAFVARPRSGAARPRLALLLALLAASWLGRAHARVTLVPGGLLPPTQEDALAIFRPLHANIYRAFDYTDPSDVYDALDRSVEGPLLERLYEEVYASLVQEENEGAVGRVQSVDLLETEFGTLETDAQGRPRFDLVAHWQVAGAVFHWGHVHWRTQAARAHYVVRRGASGWRIAESQILEQKVISAVPSGLVPPAPGEPFEMPDEL